MMDSRIKDIENLDVIEPKKGKSGKISPQELSKSIDMNEAQNFLIEQDRKEMRTQKGKATRAGNRFAEMQKKLGHEAAAQADLPPLQTDVKSTGVKTQRGAGLPDVERTDFVDARRPRVEDTFRDIGGDEPPIRKAKGEEIFDADFEDAKKAAPAVREVAEEVGEKAAESWWKKLPKKGKFAIIAGGLFTGAVGLNALKNWIKGEDEPPVNKVEMPDPLDLRMESSRQLVEDVTGMDKEDEVKRSLRNKKRDAALQRMLNEINEEK
jgi:hypothetical protein